ncbi:BLUF domain-containing protein [Psychrobacter sp. AOP22-C1-C5]|uniref:BLUF domain-containing protein n=1 Tax=Psychrobacter sp. AOP22-C1-C5 TaxID=3457716 RepID=UPI004034FD5F
MQTIINYDSDRNIDGDHILMSLTYIGNNKGKDDGVELIRTLERWRISNEKSNVTSAIAINDNYFIQNLEGSRSVINEVIATLINEYPLIALNIVEVKEIETRSWDGFLIRYLTSSVQDEEYTLKSFSAGADFNPYLMKKTQITGFIKAIFAEQTLSKFQNDIVSC